MFRAIRNWIADFFLWNGEDVRRERWVSRDQDARRFERMKGN